MDAVRARICQIGRDNYRHEREPATEPIAHLVSEPQKIPGTLLDASLGSELHFHSTPSPISETDDDIAFQIVLVPVVVDLPIYGLGIRSDIAHDHRFEQKSERLEIVQEVGRSGIQEHRGYCWIEEMVDR